MPIPDELIPQLRAHKTAQATERLAAGNQWEDWDLVFATLEGKPISPPLPWYFAAHPCGSAQPCSNRRR